MNKINEENQKRRTNRNNNEKQLTLIKLNVVAFLTRNPNGMLKRFTNL